MKLAIDIALLPPEDITDKVIAVNRHASEKGNAKGRLGKDDFYPHISLAMGVIKQDDFAEVQNIVNSVVKNHQSFTVSLSDLYYVIGTDGIKSYALKIKNTKQLQELHEKLMKGLAQFFTYDATEQELFKKEGETAVKPTYVNTYLEDHSFQHFDSHITLRCKEVELMNLSLPITFLASRVVICHMGENTTCRKILFICDLQKQ